MIVNGKIFPVYEVFYIQSMLFNCQSAIRSINYVEKAFAGLPEEVSDDDIAKLPTRAILNEVQNIVVQGAALSRYFWPVRNGHEDRAKTLREALDVIEENPLREREFRNAIEHFDERLDNYLSSGIVGHIFPEYVGIKPDEDGVQGHYFRAFFIDSGSFRLLDGEYKMHPIVEEILRLGDILQEADLNGCMLPRK
ncbi:hypothetical protein [Sulfuricurvum sp.]|uniref:hypothetical protein n=1 Tax=Sulfuricurvum sp. TaxID=2025608 RepID=UPI0026068A61|nr:hypothetical protein [Sulfuricurvum sp.]MDD4883446.1 hypothetical protein [Sulfuricurvum sp.]